MRVVYFRFFIPVMLLFTNRCISCQLPITVSYTYLTNRSTFEIIQNASVVTKLEDYREVYVENQHIPVLCPSIFKVYSKTSFNSFFEILLEENTLVQFINCNITDITPGQYILKGILGMLKISKNKLKVLRSGIFNQMPVRQLDLSYNNLNIIESRTFEGNVYLEYLILRGNKLRNLDMLWFRNTINLRSVNLAENFLTTLNQGCFSEVKDNRISINLAYNKIVRIEEHTFAGLQSIDSLLLQNNNLSSLPDDFFRNTSFYILHIGNNYLSELPGSFYSCDRNCNNLYINDNKFSCDTLVAIQKSANNSDHCHVRKRTKVFSDNNKNCKDSGDLIK